MEKKFEATPLSVDNIVLGRSEFLVPLTEIYKLAMQLKGAKEDETERTKFILRLRENISNWAQGTAMLGFPVAYVYHEASDTSYTNFNGLVAAVAFCPPEARKGYLNAIGDVISYLPRDVGDQNQRKQVHLLAVKLGDKHLITEKDYSRMTSKAGSPGGWQKSIEELFGSSDVPTEEAKTNEGHVEEAVS